MYVASMRCMLAQIGEPRKGFPKDFRYLRFFGLVDLLPEREFEREVGIERYTGPGIGERDLRLKLI